MSAKELQGGGTPGSPTSPLLRVRARMTLVEATAGRSPAPPAHARAQLTGATLDTPGGVDR
jgi:hypothetical protein